MNFGGSLVRFVRGGLHSDSIKPDTMAERLRRLTRNQLGFPSRVRISLVSTMQIVSSFLFGAADVLPLHVPPDPKRNPAFPP